MIIVEPNPKLIDYLEKADNSKEGYAFYYDGQKREYVESDEWHYLLSDLELNIFLLKRLDNFGLLKQKNKICDAGIGLGSALYDLYLQSQDLTDKHFEFIGIEKNKKYIEFLNKNLIEFWNGKLELIEEDIMNCDYSEYDVIYSYCPFKNETRIMEFYTKLANEMKVGSCVIDPRNSRVLERFEEFEKIDLEGMWIFCRK